MEQKNRGIVTAKIPFDAQSEAVGKDGSGIVLLFDEKRGCYYKTTIAHILMVALKESREFLDGLDQRFAELRQELVDEQHAFISDMTKTNQAMIELVKEGTNK